MPRGEWQGSRPSPRIHSRSWTRDLRYRTSASRGIAAQSRARTNSTRSRNCGGRFPRRPRSYESRAEPAAARDLEVNSITQRKRILILASKLGYQTRAFGDAAEKLGVEVAYGTDRCHKLEDPWGDGAVALHLEDARQAASEIAEQTRDRRPDAILALGDRPTTTA